MFYLVDVREKVGIEAQNLKKDIRECAEERLEELHLKEENGVFLGVVEIKSIGGTGKILPERPYIYFDIEYTSLFFQPAENEIVDGIITEIAEFGPFVRLGPIEAFIHISQIVKEKLTYNPEQDIITTKDGKFVVKKDEKVRALVANSTISEEKVRVNLTMRQDGLGLISALEKEKKPKKAKK
ncbi:MAG: DNA-directed RNA polymerase [Candidatus Aenigmarchaeota archaeon]|nr:DNA-directed RNA polymerase [Candidatus Aenigmarchaeota archaeon]